MSDHVPLRQHLEALLGEHQKHVDQQFEDVKRRLDRVPAWPQIITVTVAIVGLALTGYAFIA